MAVDHNSVPNRTSLPFPAPPPPWAPLLHHRAASTGEPCSSAATAAGKKVKLLCSFGGRIGPRPGDDALRYVGGDTRLISVPKFIRLPDLIRKISDAASIPAGMSVALKYQLPDEDLDALISVSTTEDLENMMEEHEKLLASDPSAKLRTFIFVVPSSPSSSEPDDTGQSWKESAHNTGSSEVTDCDNEGTTNSGKTQISAWPEPLPIEPHQFQHLNPQQLGIVGGPPIINLVPHLNSVQFPPNPSLAHAICPHLKQSRVDSYLEENLYGGKAVRPPLAQLPPLPISYLQAQNVEQYSLNRAPMSRLHDCVMCQKMLPHVHSDTSVQGHGNGLPAGSPEVSPLYYSHRQEDTRKLQAPQIVTGALSGNVGEPVVLNRIAAGELGVRGPPQMVQSSGERSVLRKMDILDHARVLLPPESLGLIDDAQSTHVMLLSNLPRSRHEDPLQQQQLYHVGREVTTKPHGIDARFVRDGDQQQVSWPMEEFSSDHVRPIDAMMEAMRLNPADNSCLNDQWKAVAKPNLGFPMDLRPNSSLLDGEKYNLQPQVAGNELFSERLPPNSKHVPEGNFVNPINQPHDPTSLNVPCQQNLHPAGTGQLGDHCPYAANLRIGVESQDLNGWSHEMPAYPCTIDPAYTDRTINESPNRNWRDEVSQYHKDMLHHISAAQRGNVLFASPIASSPTVHVEPFQESRTAEDSLFLNEDPWKFFGGTNSPPQRPHKMTKEESVILNNFCVENRLRMRNDSDVVALSEEGAFHHSVDPLDLSPEPIQTMKDAAEEHIKQELQAVAEGVAASVLQSPVLPVPNFFAHETKEHNPEYVKERGINDDIPEKLGEVTIVDQTIEEKTNAGLQIKEDIGRLQIIKNSDLEELRELGAGTFGTVYHGKWSGSDVAIKRINERCFAGKPSEEERMRADFWNEACKLADLHHPNVVAFYGVVLDGPGGSVATVTEYMVNGSLRNALQSNDRTCDRRKRLLIATDVAFGMEYLHGKNIVHFDLKSDNLLVNLRDPHRPICKVGDLGLSKVKCRTLISGGVRGTLPWMAPELLNGSSSLVSEKVDVFSFGIVMWELLTGEEPYANLHYGAIIGGIVSNTLRPEVPKLCNPDWRSLMEECWSSEPSERPTFREIVSRLRSMAAHLPSKARLVQ